MTGVPVSADGKVGAAGRKPVAITGEAVRERVHLLPLPQEVVTIYPEWRGYEFILVHEQILVIDPRTDEIVDVLPA